MWIKIVSTPSHSDWRHEISIHEHRPSHRPAETEVPIGQIIVWLGFQHQDDTALVYLVFNFFNGALHDYYLGNNKAEADSIFVELTEWQTAEWGLRAAECQVFERSYDGSLQSTIYYKDMTYYWWDESHRVVFKAIDL